MTSDVIREEDGGPGRVEIVMNVFGIKVTLNVTNMVYLIIITTCVINRRNKRQIYSKRN